jgi:hypothetical protein
MISPTMRAIAIIPAAAGSQSPMPKANYSGLSRYVRAARASHYDTFELPKAARRLLPDQLVISFCTDREGNIPTLTALFEPSLKTSFSPLSCWRLQNPAFRRQCAGTSVHRAATAVVGQDNDGSVEASRR